METSALTITGARPLRAATEISRDAGSGDLRAAWLSRLPSVEPGSMSEAYRSFRAGEQVRPAIPGNAPAARPTPRDRPPPILTGSLPAALAAYGETMEG
jgi:hypothetical protein